MINPNIVYKLIGLYIIVAIMAYVLSNHLIFIPPQGGFRDSEKIVKLTTNDGARISAIYLQNPLAMYTILYSHGNAEDLSTTYSALQQLYDLGFSVLGYDYRGYGSSEGYPSEKATYQDIQAAFQYLVSQKKISPNKIILYGRSVGSGPSVDLAVNHAVGGLILEGAFVSAYRVVTRAPMFPFDKYKNLDKLQRIHVPILFIHSINDEVIPFWHGEMLYKNYKGPKQYYWVDNAGHNDLAFYSSAEYKNTIQLFAKSL
jgi:fermentation-respiration switch protein FrsA (DUF1100 family)